ncbi:sterol desaturase family protein [Massilia sp. TSP1-1-2]|uniref:sterol desaturase family protein n=1 Tax=unclassified Massilia TaxID=2609279 RepID=UPI003CE9FF2A
MKAMETTAYYSFGVPLYFLLIWLEARRAKKRGMPAITLPVSINNLSTGLGTMVIGLFLGPALILLYEWAFRHFALLHWGAGSWQPWVLALVLADFGHYCHHRFDHRVAACWTVHGVHHQPEQMNYTVAMRHAWFSDLYSFPFYVWLPLAGVPTAHFFIITTLMSLHALLTHTEQFRFPSLGIFVTPQSHVLHHAKNDPYVDKNFGAMLCIWDRLFGTHVRRDPAHAPQYGSSNGYETHDGVRSQFVLQRDLWRLARQAGSWREGLRVLFGRPGTLPAGARAPVPGTALPAASIGRGVKIYAAVQFVVTLCLSLLVLIPRDDFAWQWQLAAAVATVAALSSIGGLLDGRRRAWAVEAARCAVTLAAGAWVLLA